MLFPPRVGACGRGQAGDVLAGQTHCLSPSCPVVCRCLSPRVRCLSSSSQWGSDGTVGGAAANLTMCPTQVAALFVLRPGLILLLVFFVPLVLLLLLLLSHPAPSPPLPQTAPLVPPPPQSQPQHFLPLHLSSKHALMLPTDTGGVPVRLPGPDPRDAVQRQRRASGPGSGVWTSSLPPPAACPSPRPSTCRPPQRVATCPPPAAPFTPPPSRPSTHQPITALSAVRGPP